MATAYKFFNIGKANAEVERLETELKSANEKIAALTANEPEALAAAEGEITKLKADLAQNVSDLATAKQSIQSLTKEKEALAASAAELKKKADSVDAEAARKAAEITAAQGQPPIQAGGAGAENPGGSDIVTQLQAIEDPVKRAQFFKANEKAIRAAQSRK